MRTLLRRLLLVTAGLGIMPASAETLLVVRKTGNAVDFMDPGSTLSIIDLEQPGELKRIDLAPHTRPHGVAWFAADRLAVTTEGSKHVLVIDPADSRIVSAIKTAQETSHMVVVSADARRAYATNIGSGTATAIDLVTGRKLTDLSTGAGSEALALSPDGPNSGWQ